MSFKESLCAIQREYAHLLRSHFLPESRAFDAVGQDVLRFQQEVLGRLISSPVVAVTDGKAIGGYARQVADFFADVKEFWASREQRLLQEGCRQSMPTGPSNARNSPVQVPVPTIRPS